MGRVQGDLVGGGSVFTCKAPTRKITIGPFAALQRDQAIREFTAKQAAVDPLISLLETVIGLFGWFGFDAVQPPITKVEKVCALNTLHCLVVVDFNEVGNYALARVAPDANLFPALTESFMSGIGPVMLQGLGQQELRFTGIPKNSFDLFGVVLGGCLNAANNLGKLFAGNGSGGLVTETRAFRPTL